MPFEAVTHVMSSGMGFRTLARGPPPVGQEKYINKGALIAKTSQTGFVSGALPTTCVVILLDNTDPNHL